MDFCDAYPEMKAGEKVTLPDWEGFWQWDDQKKTIMIHHKDGRVLDIRDTGDVDHTVNLTLQDQWQLYRDPAPVTDHEANTYWWDELNFKPDQPHVLKLGANGPKVEALQKELNKLGAKLKPDGDFGPAVQKAVRNIQIGYGLVADGVYGDKTAAAMRGEPIPTLLSHNKVVDVADRIGCKVEAVMAVSGVESRGHGFWSNGFPAILYERHWMARLLKKKGTDPTPYIKTEPNIVNTHTGGYKGGIPEYGRLNKAKKIDIGCALQSASWGAYQIMCFHWKELGYDSPEDFVDRMRRSEDEHIEAFARFILNNEVLTKALQDLDFYTFGIHYNGSAAVRENHYPTHMRNEFNRLVDMNKD